LEQLGDDVADFSSPTSILSLLMTMCGISFASSFSSSQEFWLVMTSMASAATRFRGSVAGNN
jgi:hypothetical protein